MTARTNPYDPVPRVGNRERAMQRRNRRVWIFVALVACLLGGLILWPVVWFAFNYGAKFDFPAALPLPQGTTAVLSADGADDDDPMRSRQQVVDVPAGSTVSLPDFYRDLFPAGQGWSDLPLTGDQELCLVNKRNDEYTEVVEVFNYTGSRVPAQPGRHLVTISRFQSADADPCGLANAWVDSDLF